jgi:hypothetical protein
MKFHISIRAAIGNHSHVVIGIARLEERGEDDAARCDAKNHQISNFACAQNHLKIGSGERTHAMFRYHDVALLRAERWVNRPGRSTKELLMLRRRLDRREQLVPGADFGQPWAESNLNVNQRHRGFARSGHDICGTCDKFIFRFYVDRNDSRLAVHSEDSCMRYVHGPQFTWHAPVTSCLMSRNIGGVPEPRVWTFSEPGFSEGAVIAFGEVDFSLFFTGRSGTFKTALPALCQQHFGAEMDARRLPGNFASTANALEELAFLAKDALLVVDDFVPTGGRW